MQVDFDSYALSALMHQAMEVVGLTTRSGAQVEVYSHALLPEVVAMLFLCN